MTDALQVTDRSGSGGLSLAPMRGLRPAVDPARLGQLLCPPYDVIDAERRHSLLDSDPDNAVAVVLPEPTPAGYAGARDRLQAWIADGLLRSDTEPALYVYELRGPDGHVTRGLLGAVELRDPADGVILPHENTMAGPVADRLAVMTATGADLEPIYLVYDGGGAASDIVASVGRDDPLARATTPDGTTHTLWSITDPGDLERIAADLASRSALIADGHHRYATYRERQRLQRAEAGAGPWDRGLALLVDTSEYGPQVHPIHRTIAGIGLEQLAQRLTTWARVTPASDPAAALDELGTLTGFAAVLTDGRASYVLHDADGTLAAASRRADEADALTSLDVTVLHRGLVERALELVDDVDTVGYAHDVSDAISQARAVDGVAVLVRATPIDAVAQVAAAGARMPRKSTLFTPKPASGLVMRLLADQTG